VRYDVSFDYKPTSCEIRAVVGFLHAKIMIAAEMHNELCVVYGQNIMNEGTAIQWCRMFKDGLTNVHDEERSGQSSVVSNDRVQNVGQKNCERRRFSITELPFDEFSQISCTLLYKIITG
jgi:hypothetical protein